MSLTKTKKDNLLAHLEAALSGDGGIAQVAQHVVAGDISMDELLDTGQLTSERRKQIEVEIERIKVDLQKRKEKEAEQQAELDCWNKAFSENTIEAFNNYLEQYPQGAHVSQAKTMIAGIQATIKNNKKEDCLNELREDINAYNTTILNRFEITFDDLKNADIAIPDEIRSIWDNKGIDLHYGETPSGIPNERTEIYFWGAPGSGKTCTLAAILSTAKKKGLFEPQEGNGFMYMTQLSSLFNNGVATLPPPSPVEVTQGLSFDLRDTNRTKHPVTLIEISGEIFECFSNAMNGLEIPDDGHSSTFDSLLGFLNSSANPKFHFFVIDVDNNKQDKYGLTQMDYLQAAATYFDNKKIFNEKTAGIYILVTKSDLLDKDKSKRTQAAIDKLTNNYLNLINSLKSIAYQHKLIDKSDKLTVIPFTLGEVYLQDKCKFDPSMSVEVIKILQQNVAKTYIKRKSSWLNW